MLHKYLSKTIEPASGAIIMANGVFLIGGIQHFALLDLYLGKLFAIFLIITWVCIFTSLISQFFHKEFLFPFLKNPIGSFAIGTWIAGVSILCHVLLKYFPVTLPVIKAIAIINTVLWLFFLATCFYNYKQLIRAQYQKRVQGIILLSTVGTQSIVVLLDNIFNGMSLAFSESVIILGLIFYIIGIILITKRYVTDKKWNLAKDWTNTNCIIHGALSISGLAMVTTNSFSSSFITSFWILVFTVLVLIELLEIIRGITRVKQMGFSKGIFTYHISQWSRNFTFGMFYAFSLVMHSSTYYHLPEPLFYFQDLFMNFWAWIVLVTLLVQLANYFNAKYNTSSLLRKYVH